MDLSFADSPPQEELISTINTNNKDPFKHFIFLLQFLIQFF
jgi:hypothetical protein